MAAYFAKNEHSATWLIFLIKGYATDEIYTTRSNILINIT